MLARSEKSADIDAVRAVNAAAFPTPEESELVDALRTDPSWIDGFSRVVEDDSGRVVGHALLTRCRIGSAPALCLAPCAVLPEAQGKGFGKAVVRDALETARLAGEDTVVVLGHPDYYPRFGFEKAADHGVGLSIDVPEDALMTLSLQGGPVPQGTVRYAEPFGL